TERFDTTPGGNPTVASESADAIQAASGSTGTRVATAGSGGANIGQLVALTPVNPATIDAEYRIVSITGTYLADGTLNPSRSWTAAIASFKAGVCGDGFVDPSESCDQGAANGTSTSCCTSACTFKSSGTQCRAAV